MKARLLLSAALVMASPDLSAAAGGNMPEVIVRDVRFQTMRENWVRVDIEIQGGPVQAGKPAGSRFHRRVRVRCLLGYPAGHTHIFYRAETELVAVEAHRRVQVPFFLPGVEVERLRLASQPEAWLVELATDGRELPLQRAGISPSLRRNPAAVESMRKRVATDGVANDGILLPAHLAPIPLRLESDPPAVVRKEAVGR